MAALGILALKFVEQGFAQHAVALAVDEDNPSLLLMPRVSSSSSLMCRSISMMPFLLAGFSFFWGRLVSVFCFCNRAFCSSSADT